jgi:hypothetical protein
MKQLGQAGQATAQAARQVSMQVGVRVAPRLEAREESQAAAWYGAVALAVVVWSVSYLIRQPGVATTALGQPFSPVGDFAFEGMLLALGWLGLIAAACIALLTGAARFEEATEHSGSESGGR